MHGDKLLHGMIKQSEGSLMAQNTIFGWIMSERTSSGPEAVIKANFTSIHTQTIEEVLGDGE